jgi:hypothetical protein
MKILFILSLLFITKTWANDLTLYFIPSPKGMDWSSPSSITMSGIKNRLSFEKRYIGHVFVELSCGDEKKLSAMTGDTSGLISELLIQGRGLGILFHSFEGSLETENEIGPELEGYLNSGNVNFTRFLLNDKQCQRALTYLKEYKEHKVDRYYGLSNRPRYGEGAGCSAYAVSFPDVLDILDQEMKESWSQTVNVPFDLSGPPVTDKYVTIFSLLLNDSWAKENVKHQKLIFWSPDKMHAWVQEKVAKKQGHYPLMKIGNSQGVVVEKSHYPTPEGPIWLQKLDPKDKKRVLGNLSL